jgi:hypothetical protein
LPNVTFVKRLPHPAAALALLALAACAGSGPRVRGPATVFVANRDDATVAAYAAPYARPPVKVGVAAFSGGEPPEALAFDPVGKVLAVGAGSAVLLYDTPLEASSKPRRILHEAEPVIALAVEHRFYKDGLLEVATAGGGMRAYSGRDGYAAPSGRVDGVVAYSMIFDDAGRLFVADRTRSDGSLRILWPATGRPYAPPLARFLLGPSALAFDAHGELWVGDYDVDGDGSISGIAAFAPPYTQAPARSFPDEGGGETPDGGSFKLLFAGDALVAARIADVRVYAPPYDRASAQLFACRSASNDCGPFDMAVDANGSLIVAVRSLSCERNRGALLVFDPPFAAGEKPAARVTAGVACPTALAAGD